MAEIVGPAQTGWRERWPLVVIGAGACGLVAGLAAARRGVRAVILEKGAEVAGNTARSTGLIPAAGSRLQRQAGILDDSPELLASDILEKNHHQSDPTLTRVLCEAAPGLAEWLVDEAGCELVCQTDFLYPGHSRLRMHGPAHGYGAELVRQLERAVRADPRLELRLEGPVRGLVADNRRVLGVQTDEGAIAAEAVVLALDGFGANRAMVAEHLGPVAAAAHYFGSPTNTGEGIRWGIALGAATEHMAAYQGHASLAAPDGPLVTWAAVVNGAILVNRAGRRFGCESQGYSEYTRDVLAQPGGEAWLVFDQEVYDASLGTRFDEVLPTGKVVRAETLPGLAATWRLPADALAETVEAVNRAARGQAADGFGRANFAAGPLEPPFYAIHVRGALFHTQGGLKVDVRARVLRRDGTAIAGLYAGGGTAAGISGDGVEGYLAGNGLLAATALGRIAGETVADELATPARRSAPPTAQ
jgi:fumarate reductase flavoprotein subunit